MNTVKAKFTCNQISENKEGEEVKGKTINMSAVVAYGANGERLDENETWSKWTPSGTLSIYITNPGAWSQFEQGKDYYLTFEEVPEKASGL